MLNLDPQPPLFRKERESYLLQNISKMVLECQISLIKITEEAASFWILHESFLFALIDYLKFLKIFCQRLNTTIYHKRKYILSESKPIFDDILSNYEHVLPRQKHWFYTIELAQLLLN